MRRLRIMAPMPGCALALLLLATFSLRAQAQPLPEAPMPDARCRQWVDSVLSVLDADGKIGQFMVASLPASADKAARKQVREWVRKYGVGGLLFSQGAPEEVAILSNIAAKEAKVPTMMFLAGKRGVSMRLEGTPNYPDDIALNCITDGALKEACRHEAEREYRELGVARFHDEEGRQAPFLCYDATEVADAFRTWKEDVKSGAVSCEALDARCRAALAYKYRLGVTAPRRKLRVSGMSHRIHTDEARELATRSRRSAVTVLNNCFGVLPLVPPAGKVAVLSIGEKEGDAPFVEALKRHTDVVRFHLSRFSDGAARQEVAKRLAEYRRVIISMAGDGYVSGQNAAFLEGLDLQAPLVYTFFTSHHTLQLMVPALAKSAAVVLAHSAEADLQQYVADVLFAKEPANGRMPISVGRLFPAGAGCVIEPGMEPGKIIPEDYGMKSYVLQRIDALARKGVEAGAYPGCRVLVWKDGVAVYDKGFGTHSDKDTTAVRPSDLFDLASLTKTTATLLAVMKLYDEGKIKLDDKVSAYLPLLRNGNKRNITIRELLLHESGLPPYIRFYLDLIDPNSVKGPYSQSWKDKWHRTRISEHGYYCSDFKFKKGMVNDKNTSVHTLPMADGLWLNKSFEPSILQRIAKCEPESKRYVYSDLGFVLLQQVVEKVTGVPMELYLAREFYAPMGLERTLFLPLTKFAKTEIMPTAANDFLRRQDLCGYVHDETAACMGGVAGNAGLFSTAEEVAKLCQMLLNGGEFNGKRLLSEATCRLFTTEKSAVSRRGLGFDRPDVSIVKRSPCAPSAPEAVYGHTGFTGTCAWADPENKTVYVFLCNRLCPHVWNTKLGDMDIRRDIQELIYKSIIPQTP